MCNCRKNKVIVQPTDIAVPPEPAPVPTPEPVSTGG
jgi:hypothetical protein